MKGLSIEEQELITYVYFEGKSLKGYSEGKGIAYFSVASRKTVILKKLKKFIDMPNNKVYLN